MKSSDEAVDPGRRAFLRGQFFQAGATTGSAVIDPTACMAMNGVICMSCQQACSDRAILLDDRFRPSVDSDRCNASGACIDVCPSKAIKLS
jgi:ferredoxin-type protein NapF